MKIAHTPSGPPVAASALSLAADECGQKRSTVNNGGEIFNSNFQFPTITQESVSPTRANEICSCASTYLCICYILIFCLPLFFLFVAALCRHFRYAAMKEIFMTSTSSQKLSPIIEKSKKGMKMVIIIKKKYSS